MAADPPLSPVAEIARRHDPDRFLCALFAPAERREALFALIAFNHELARAREVAANPMAALIRLQWWRDAVEEARAGQPPRRHEVAQPLHAAIRGGALDPDSLIALADAREAETEEGGIPTQQALLSYLRGTAGGMSVTTGRLLGAEGRVLAALQSLGTAYGLAGLLRAVPALAAQGRSLLPADLLAAQGLTVEQAARDPRLPGLRPVATTLAGEAERMLEEGRRGLREVGKLPRESVAAALPTVLARRDLRRLARRGYDISTPPGPRGAGDRLAVVLAGLTGRV